MPEVRPWVLETPHSGIRRMLEHARDVDSPVMLINGDPNFTTPAHIIDGAAEAARAGATGYSPGDGLVPLRDEIVAKLRRVNGIEVGRDQVCVTTGACGGLYTTFMVLVGPGDEVLVPDPGWSNYAAILHVLNGKAVPYPLRPDAGGSSCPAAVDRRPPRLGGQHRMARRTRRGRPTPASGRTGPPGASPGLQSSVSTLTVTRLT